VNKVFHKLGLKTLLCERAYTCRRRLCELCSTGAL